ASRRTQNEISVIPKNVGIAWITRLRTNRPIAYPSAWYAPLRGTRSRSASARDGSHLGRLAVSRPRVIATRRGSLREHPGGRALAARRASSRPPRVERRRRSASARDADARRAPSGETTIEPTTFPVSPGPGARRGRG